jgi:hypothetical protein
MFGLILPAVGGFIMTGLAFTGIKSIIGDTAEAVVHPYEPQSGINTRDLIIVGALTIAGIIAYKKLVK